MPRTYQYCLTAVLSLALTLTGPLNISPSTAPHGHSHFELGPDEATAGTVKYTCSMHPFIIRDEPGNCPICGMTLTPVKVAAPEQGPQQAREKRKVKQWVSPRDPNFIRDKPGKDPTGAALVPVYEEETPAAAITIDPTTQQNMGVRVAPVSRRNMNRTIRTVGVVGYEEPRQYSLNSKIDGWIEKLYVNETGGKVKKGQPLLEIYSPDLVTAQEEYLLALRNKGALSNSKIPAITAGADRLLEASRNRLRYWDISEAQIRNLEKTGAAKKTLTLFAKNSGILTQKKVTEGMFIKAGMELFQIADISNVWVYADIYEYELPWLRVGQTATIQPPFQAEPIQGKISTIYPYVETKTRTVKARIDLVNPGLELKPEMYVNVRVQTQPLTNVLAVPKDAVINSGEQQTVFVSLGQGRFEPRRVRLGAESEDGFVQVVQGLKDNENIVVSAQFLLDSESTLRAAMQKMTEPAKPQPAVGTKNKAKAEESLDSLFEK